MRPTIPTVQDRQQRVSRKSVALAHSARFFLVLRATSFGTLLVLSLLVLIWQVVLTSQGAIDFCPDYIASRRLLQGTFPYLPLHLWPGYSSCAVPIDYNVHPPTSLLLLVPFALLAKAPAFLLWGCICLAAYVASVCLLLRALGWFSLRNSTLCIGASLFWSPLIAAEGSLNFFQLLTLLLAAAWVLERKGYAGWAGILLGLASLLKLWPAAFLLSAVLRRQKRLAVSGGLVFGLGILLSLVVVGPEAYLAYFGPVQRATLSLVPIETNTSVVGAITRLWTGSYDPFWNPPFRLSALVGGLDLPQANLVGEIVAVLLVVATLALIWWTHRQFQHGPVEVLSQGLLVTVLLLAFPLSWYAGLITLLLPGATIILALRQLPKPGRWWLVLLGLSTLALCIPEVMLVFYQRWFPVLQAIHLAGWGTIVVGFPTWALLLLAGLQAHLLWRARKVQGVRSQGSLQPSANVDVEVGT
ncbi:MAG TPA: glycosyltransferase 87 family protein [Ktedonobacterales bacterium]|nr:glycosyltransferase 87 family protein [Ktedonobacterales bacterium]